MIVNQLNVIKKKIISTYTWALLVLWFVFSVKNYVSNKLYTRILEC